MSQAPTIPVPTEPTKAMIAAALAVDWTNEDEAGTVHNVWHAMLAASPALASPVPSDAGVMGLDVNALAQAIGKANIASPLGAEIIAERLMPFLRSCLVPSGGMDQEAVAGEAVSALNDIIAGIDKNETEDESGWWPTSTGTTFGASVKAQLEKLVAGLVSALDAERAAHKREQHRHFLTAQAAEALVQSLRRERDVAQECHAHALDLAKKEIARAEAAEARSALLEETVETTAARFKLCAEYIGGSARVSDFLRIERSEYALRCAAEARTSLTQHKAPALPASDAEGGANGA